MNKISICAVAFTIAAWFIGLLLDANIKLGDPLGFLCLRILFPILVMGVFVLNDKNDSK